MILTHAHCDHCWGIMGDDGARHFPNAQIYMSQADLDYWTDEAKLSMAEPKYMKPFVEGARKNLLPNRDTTHHQVLLFEKPLIEFAYDTDSKKSAQTRVRILDMLASTRTPLLAYHFPWPGIGHAAKQGDGFRYYPTPMEMTRL